MKGCCKKAVKIQKKLLKLAAADAATVDPEKVQRLQQKLAKLEEKKCCRKALKKLRDKLQRKAETAAAEGVDEKSLNKELPERTLTRLAKLIRQELNKSSLTGRSEDLTQAMWWFEQANAAMADRSTDLFAAVSEMLSAGMEAITRVQGLKPEPDSGS